MLKSHLQYSYNVSTPQFLDKSELIFEINTTDNQINLLINIINLFVTAIKN